MLADKLHSTGVVLGYRRFDFAITFDALLCERMTQCYELNRSNATQYPNISLVKIEGVVTRQETQFYLGKRVCLARRVKKTAKNPTGHKIVWGKICKSHGGSGVVQARFPRNLPPKAVGAKNKTVLFL
eukprot:gene10769-12545_t